MLNQNGVTLAGANQRRIDPESYSGTRKLIRPSLAITDRRRDPAHSTDPLSHAMAPEPHAAPVSSHAEAFYFQKQVQQQTELTIVLEDGEQLHGVIEWYDRCAIKLRSGRHRILVYKSSIKYLFKTSDVHAAGSVMK